MISSFHYLFYPGSIPTIVFYLAAALGFFVWGRLHRTAYPNPKERLALLEKAGIRILTGFATLTLASQALQRNLIFACPWHLWPLFVLGAIAVEGVAFLYQFEQSGVKPPRMGRLLTAARLLLVLALILMLCQPVRSWDRIRIMHRQVAILADISPSMTVSDNNATPAEKIRLAYLLALPGVPRPSPLLDQVIQFKEIQQKLSAQADELASLTTGEDEALRKSWRERNKDLEPALEAAQKDLTRQATKLNSVMNEKFIKSNAGYHNAVNAISVDLSSNVYTRVVEAREQIKTMLKDSKGSNIAAQAVMILKNIRLAATTLEAEEPKLDRVAEVLDTALYHSLSNNIRTQIDEAAMKKRVNLAGDILCGKTQFRENKQDILLERLQKTYGVRLYTFASETAETDAKKFPAIIAAAAERPATNAAELSTDLAAALEQVTIDTPTEQLAGILLLTDGNHNGAKDIEPVARNLGLKSVPVSTIVFGGNRQPPTDAAIVSVEAPAAVSTNDRVDITAQLKLDSLTGMPVVVTLFRDGQPVSTQMITAASMSFRPRVSLADTPRTNGLTVYKVTVQCVSNDVAPANNEGDAPIYVTDDQTHLLMADGMPRWEFRYLKNLFSAKDSAVRMQYIIFHPDQIDQAPPRQPVAAATSRPADKPEATAWPATEEEWMKFDVIILGDVETDLLNPAQIEILKKFVIARGGCLVIIAGPVQMPRAYTQTPLAEVLPVIVAPLDPRQPAGPDEAYRFMLTAEGRENPILRLTTDPARNLALWNAMPNLSWRHSIQGLKPGATVLAYALPTVPPAFMRTGEGNTPDAETLRQRRQYELDHPLIVTHQTGAGRVIFFAFDQSWRLRYRSGDLWHHKFWGQTFRWATADKLPFGSGSIRMGLDQWRYDPGTPANVRVRVSKADNTPVTGVKLAVTCARREADGKPGTELRKELQPEIGSPGMYAASLGTFAPGRYDVILDPAQSPTLAALASKPIRAEFVVQAAQSSELVNLAADRDLLAHIAGLTSGKVADLARARDTIDDFGPPKVTIRENRQFNLWNSWLMWLIIVALTGTEWVLRKRKGLP